VRIAGEPANHSMLSDTPLPRIGRDTSTWPSNSPDLESDSYAVRIGAGGATISTSRSRRILFRIAASACASRSLICEQRSFPSSSSGQLIALCVLALALIFVPSSATRPLSTHPLPGRSSEPARRVPPASSNGSCGNRTWCGCSADYPPPAPGRRYLPPVAVVAGVRVGRPRGSIVAILLFDPFCAGAASRQDHGRVSPACSGYGCEISIHASILTTVYY
jgi:hypothetical protein